MTVISEILNRMIEKDGSYFGFILGMGLISITYMAAEEVKKYGFKKAVNDLWEEISLYLGNTNPWRIAV